MGYKIISGRYETGTQVQQMAYKQFLGNVKIQEKFDLYFHWFNIVHEMGHIIVDPKKKPLSSPFKILHNIKIILKHIFN